MPEKSSDTGVVMTDLVVVASEWPRKQQLFCKPESPIVFGESSIHDESRCGSKVSTSAMARSGDNTLAPCEIGFGLITQAIAMDQLHSLKVFEALRSVSFQSLMWDLVMGLKRTDNAFESDSRSARFDCYPYASPNFVQAVEDTFFNIEERGAICCIRGADMGRYRPFHSVLCLFHFNLPD